MKAYFHLGLSSFSTFKVVQHQEETKIGLKTLFHTWLLMDLRVEFTGYRFYLLNLMTFSKILHHISLSFLFYKLGMK